ncbi:hypothetical protein QQX98_000724 [Neonectria punicea]|uniref:DNA2/NAM7 helicase-like C-terminal domain-containing protein n=1 Tax=Neonectria punicea TaxID=979145 RepID=A0ABR1HTH6_9HYPO
MQTLVPWYDGRPLALAGDVRQLPPCVMTSYQKNVTGGPLNFFEKHLEISVLERLMRMQWPCWNSRRQNRIVAGGFDLAREIFYPTLGDKFEYGEQLMDTSRINYGQAQITLALIVSLTKVNVTKIVVISPYRATKAHLEDLIQRRLANVDKGSLLEKGLRNVEVSTAHSFQGEEAVAIFLTTVTRESGPGFVKDPRQFSVGITRHVDFVFLVGEIATMDDNAKEDLTLSDQGGRVLASGKKMRDAYQWFRANGRVVKVDFRAGEKAWFK